MATFTLRSWGSSLSCHSCGDLLSELRHEVQVLRVNLLVPLLGFLCRLWVVALSAITSGVSMPTADSTNEVDGDVVDLGALKLAMSNSTTVQACLVLIISERSVQRCQLSQLHALQLVLAFRNRCRLV